MRNPGRILVQGQWVELDRPRSVRSPAATLETCLATCGWVTAEPVEGGVRVTTSAGSVCGETLEEAVAGALARFGG